ncbi:HMG-box, partial [Pholiota conissans]
QEPGHIPRPRNAFIIFRSEYIQRHRDIGEDQQNELSKRAGRAWNAMSEEEKEWFREEAKKERDQHKERYPGYAY